LAETERLLGEAGLVYAGTGRSLQAARAPRYYDGPKGRVALISAASTIIPMSRAADALGEVPARPGLNPLRVQQINHVTQAQLDVLAQIEATTSSTPATLPSKEVNLFGTAFRVGPLNNGKMSYSYELNERDAKGNMLAVRQGHQNSNFTIFSLHNHEPSNE